ncbi:MAG: hypothetical protein COB33_012130 [Thiotrichaceae bacterium]|nr:hypothetical protein [Thiotrichaceae bacterium]
MPKSRKSQISLASTLYYHCVSRCVRRAFLCGKDAVTSHSFEHRRKWIEDRLHELAQIFAIDLCGYAIMSNHYHVILHIDQQVASDWTAHEVIEQWHQLFTGNLLSQRYVQGKKLGTAESAVLSDCVEEWRSRLMDISWFMRVLNEGIARQANAEDECTGRFWEGRFKSQALLDDAALIACMAYVDLNLIRAKMADTPETSAHTSIKKRIQKAQTAHSPNHSKQQVKTLLPFAGNPRKEMPKGLPFRLTDYIELVDISGRIIRKDKRGAIDPQLSPILERLNIETKHWEYLINNFESQFKSFVGTAFKLKQVCQSLGYKRTPGIRGCQSYFP